MILGRAVRYIWLLVCLAAVPAVRAQKAPSPGAADRELQRHSLAINLAKAINAAEANYKKNNGTYVSWDTLVNNGDFTESGTKWAPETYPTVAHAMYGSGAEVVPGWKLRLIISKDGNSYVLELEDVNDPKCGYTVFSDERGLVRQGRSVDCTS